MAVASTLTRRRFRKPYRPYHLHGEAVLLLSLTVFGILWLMAPITLAVKILGLIALWLFLPALLIPPYWPKIGMHDLGWQHPEHPRQPIFFNLVYILISFLPLLLWLVIAEPELYVSVASRQPWLAWLIGQGMVAMALTTVAAFCTGVLLFRLTHLIKPWLAVVLVGLLLGVTLVTMPGPMRFFGLPFSVAVTWLAWQTHSFVPAAVAMIGLNIFYDLIVFLT